MFAARRCSACAHTRAHAPAVWARPQALRARKFLHTLLSSQVRRAVALLHAEVLEFAAASRAAERARGAALEALLASIRGAVRLLWPLAEVRLFGR
jgi:hypothetical protein